jgi:hypothetical protein
MRKHFGREFSCSRGVDDREGRPREPGGPCVLEEQMRHTILMAGISMLAISGSALAASPIPPILQRRRSSSRKFRCRCRQRNHRRRLPSSPRPARRRLRWLPHRAHNPLRSRPRRLRIQRRRRSSSHRQPPRRHRPKTRPRRLARPMSGPRATGGGTARNTHGSPAAMSFRRQQSRAGRPDIGNRVRTVGFGSTAAGIKPPGNRLRRPAASGFLPAPCGARIGRL